MNPITVIVSILLTVLLVIYILIIICFLCNTETASDTIREKATLSEMKNILDGLIAGVNTDNNIYLPGTEYAFPEILLRNPDNSQDKRFRISSTILVTPGHMSEIFHTFSSSGKNVLVYTGPIRSLIFKRYAKKALSKLDVCHSKSYINELIGEITSAI